MLGGLLVLALTAAAADPVAIGADVAARVRPGAAGAVPVLFGGLVVAGTAAAGIPAAGGGLRAIALAAVLAAVGVAAALVALALRVPGWAVDPRRLPAEIGAAVTAAVGLLLGGADPGGWLLFALTGAGLAAIAVTPGRDRLAEASIAPVAIAWALLLAQAGVHTPEAYTLPPALMLLALGWYRLGDAGSWHALGPGLVLGLAPSVVAAADGGPPARVVVLALVAGGLVIAGVRLRLAAPVVVGAGALAAHAVVQLGPWLVELGTSVPRWTVMAVVGALLLLEGATYERQVTRLRAAAVRLASLR